MLSIEVKVTNLRRELGRVCSEPPLCGSFLFLWTWSNHTDFGFDFAFFSFLNQDLNFIFIFWFFWLSFQDRVSLGSKLWLSWNSLCRPGRTWTHRGPPGSVYQELGFKACTAMLGLIYWALQDNPGHYPLSWILALMVSVGWFCIWEKLTRTYRSIITNLNYRKLQMWNFGSTCLSDLTCLI